MKRVDVAIVGGGIVGLGLLHALQEARAGLSVVLVEKEATLGAHQTGHNSGVMHSGVYYNPGSLKARLCVGGAAAMLTYCRERGLPYALPGKVIVARDTGELPRLDEIERRGRANGVAGLRRIGQEELHAIEPAVQGIAALHVPGVAITDYARVAAQMATDASAGGAEILTSTAALRLVAGERECVIETTQGAIQARAAANCAGLQADRLCRGAGADPGAAILPFRGEYYDLAPAAAARIHGLVYPVPDPRFPFLGVHLTPRVAGGVEAGPNAVLATAREGYTRRDWNAGDLAGMAGYRGAWMMAARYWRKGCAEQWRSWSQPAFLRALQGLVPELTLADLRPGGAGVRAMLVAPDGRMVDDFHIVRQQRWLHLLNVPSPAATASLAIGHHLAPQLLANLD